MSLVMAPEIDGREEAARDVRASKVEWIMDGVGDLLVAVVRDCCGVQSTILLNTIVLPMTEALAVNHAAVMSKS